MPEGPSIVILRELTQRFENKTVRAAGGNSKLDLHRMVGKRILSIRNWGKHFLIEFSGFSLRIHLLMFGTYCIDARKPDKTPRIALGFAKGELNFYTCAAKYIEGDLDDSYDWRVDVMSDDWSPRHARAQLKPQPDTLACDALLDQTVFSGVGNIIKNEVLFRTRIHPLSRVGALPSRKLGELIKQARGYSFDFLRWKRDFVLRQHWCVHTKRTCPRCAIPLHKAYLGTTERRTFWCDNCQVRYE